MDDRRMSAVLAYCREICQPGDAEDVAKQVTAATRSEEIDDHELLAATRRIAAGHLDVPGLPEEWSRLVRQVREARARRAFIATLGAAPIIAVPESVTVEFPAVQPEPPAAPVPTAPEQATKPARRGLVVFPAADGPADPEQGAPGAAPPPAANEPQPPAAPLTPAHPAVLARVPVPLAPLADRSGARNDSGPLRRYRVFLATVAAGIPVVVIVGLAVNSGSASTISLPPPSPLVAQAAQNASVMHHQAPHHKRHRRAAAAATTSAAATQPTASPPTQTATTPSVATSSTTLP